MANLTFQSTVNWSGEGLKCLARIGDREIVIDEPEALGGNDEGPNPVEVLLASLGSCLTILFSLFASEHDVELDDVEVRVAGDLDPDGFLEKRAGVRPGFSAIRYQARIQSPSPAERVAALIEHVERVCPVKDTLTGVPVTGNVTYEQASAAS